jgi:hypothetical protein
MIKWGHFLPAPVVAYTFIISATEGNLERSVWGRKREAVNWFIKSPRTFISR